MPYVYDNREMSACSTVMKMMDWVEYWTEKHSNLHVYILVPPKSHTEWDDDTMMARHPQVTLLISRFYMQGKEWRRLEGYTEGQFERIAKERKKNNAYFDVVINQQAQSTFLFIQFLSELYDIMYTTSPPFKFIKHNHDFYAPDAIKGNGRYPNSGESKDELMSFMYADSVWGSCQHDVDGTIRYAQQVLSGSSVKELREKHNVVGDILKVGDYDTSYNEKPTHIHVAGRTGGGKHHEKTFEVCEMLYQMFDMKTIRTSMGGVDPEYKEVEWAECHPNAPYDVYKDALETGDLCIVFATHETGGRTYFEQGASGQVMIFNEEIWTYDQIPKDYKLVTRGMDPMKKLTLWVVNNWDQATSENTRMINHVAENFGPDSIGGATYDDMKRLEQERVDAHTPNWDEEILTTVMDNLNGGKYEIAEINDKTKHYTDNGDPILDLFGYTLNDFVLTMKSLGYVDTGERVPAFKEQTE